MARRRDILQWCFFAVLAVALGLRDGNAAPGLIATATDGTREVAFLTATPAFTLAEGESIHPQLAAGFSVEWSGSLTILRAGRYRFFATEGATLTVDDRAVGDAPLPLDAVRHPVRIQFRRSNGDARVRIEWESEFFRREPIPPSAFEHGDEPAALAATKLIERGRTLVEDLNCVACHATPGRFIGGRAGPELSRVGERLNDAWVFHWLGAPQQFRSSALMPVVLETPQDRADLAAYFSTLRGSKPPSADGDGSVIRGAELLSTLGCNACHGEPGQALTGLGSKYRSPGRLADFLANPLAVDRSGRMPDMALSRDEADALAAHLVQSRSEAHEALPPAGNPSRGRTLAVMSGCANCHAITDTQGPLRGHIEAMPFRSMNPDKGCLADAPAAPVPRYALTAEDREALRAFVRSPDVSVAPVQDLARNVEAFQCATCHEWNAPATFKLDLPPPSLTSAGDKLRASWLERVLLDHKRVRPWMETRMPHYGEVIRPMVNQFASGAEIGEGATIAPPSPDQVAAGAKRLGVGEGGLACINCHDFRGAPGLGQLRGPDLTEMNARIRSDWLRRWLWDPARIQPGTAMPAFFADMEAAQASATIDSILHALQAGADMPTPSGLGGDAFDYTVKVGASPVLLRTFMPDVPPRSIAVGLPGGQNFVFDAQNCRLAYAWSGGFLDMKPAWANRGGEPARPLGERWFAGPQAFPIAGAGVGADARPVFRGYVLDRGVPVFNYQIGEVRVTEKITATEDGSGLVREFTVSGTPRELRVSLGTARVGSVPAAGRDGWVALPPGATGTYRLEVRRAR